MSWVCPVCGHGNLDQFMECINCGTTNRIKELTKKYDKKYNKMK